MRSPFLLRSALMLTLATLYAHAGELRDATGGATWQRVRAQLPADRKSFSGGNAAELANSRCLTCHSAEMILTQPSRTPAQWKETVTKMRTVYAASLEDAEIEVLATYFATLSSTPPSNPAPSNPAPSR